jgi:uncharacterized protein (TIGR02996 family)
MPHNPFPDPAAVHPGEAAMLSAVLADLTDDLPKLVYADWLEEHGDARGPFLREFVTAARNGGKLPKPKRLSKAWLDLIGARAVMAVRDLDLPMPFAPDEYLHDARPALTFTSKKTKDTFLPVGASKFGGEPDVPTKFRWPRKKYGGPLAFLAQFNLAELSASPAAHELPSSGLLSVFYARSGEVFDTSDKGGWKVYHFPILTDLIRQAPPPDSDQADRSYPCRLAFMERLWLPEGTEFDLDAFHTIYQQSVRHTDYSHLLLGGAEWLQGLPDWAERKKGGRLKNRHLLTLDGDQNAGWTWGDAGLLYFGISADDLKAGRFDRTLFEMQCC